VVVRYQGGHNAGHRIVVDGESFALQLLPSGVLYPHITPVIGNGVVVEPKVLLDEIDALEPGGGLLRLVISGSAHLVMPLPQEIDALTSATWARTGWGRPSEASGRPTRTGRPHRPAGPGPARPKIFPRSWMSS